MKIFLDTIGCRLNQAEIESMARQFRAAGHVIVASAAEADLAVVNTCSVTSEAAADSRSRIRQAARPGTAGVVVTGCWSTLEPQAAAALPAVKLVVPNAQKDALVPQILRVPPATFELEPLERVPLPGLRARTRAFIKVQDGCDDACTFCITTVARGASRSRPVEEVIADIRSALEGGTKEVVLTGVQLGSWGRDISPARRLRDLVAEILARTALPRLRLSSLEPWHLDAEFFDLWSDARLCPHLHLPLQSGSAAVLRRMRRQTTPELFAGLVAEARRAVPGLAVTTDVIVGFPGESPDEFAETLEYVRSMDFAGGHVFTYSARPGTPAARMKGQIRHEIRKERSTALRAVFEQAAQVYRRRFVGETLPVLWEANARQRGSGWELEGLTGNYLRVSAEAPEPRWNRIDRVEITEAGPDGLSGVIQT
jgi:threonylcarbamoyladenosine tRNA methylthiotransferase MtaB